MTQEKLYADRDIIALDLQGGYYGMHVVAMTRESLHDKSAIAAELAFRDCRIVTLKGQIKAANDALNSMCEAANFQVEEEGIPAAMAVATKYVDALKDALHTEGQGD